MSAFRQRERARRAAQAAANKHGEPYVVWIEDGAYQVSAKRKWLLSVASSGRHDQARFVCEVEPEDQILMEA